MTRLDMIPDRALVLASQAGDSLRQFVPANAGKWLGAGMKLGALKAGTRAAGTLVRRNPAVLVAAAAGAGALWYLARRRARNAAENGNGTEEGGTTRSRKVAAKRGARKTSRRSSKTAE